MDFVRHVLPGKDEKFFLHFSKISTVVWAALLIFVAYLSRNVEFVLNAAFSLRGLTSGALLGGLTLAVFWRKGRALPIVLAMLTSLCVMTCVQFLPVWKATQAFWMEHVGVTVYWPWYTLLGLIVTLSTATLLRKVLPAPPEPLTPAHPQTGAAQPVTEANKGNAA